MGKKSKKSNVRKVADTASVGILGGAFSYTSIGSGFAHPIGHALGHTLLGKAAIATGWGLAHTTLGVPIIAIAALYQGVKYFSGDRD